MRFGVLADVHANLHALEAVLALLDAEGVDACLCAGDLVGYGPLPDACVEEIAARSMLTVAGNHDLIAIGRLTDERCWAPARDSLRWTAAELDPVSRDRLGALPLVAWASEAILLAHGSIDDPEHYVRTDDQAHEQLARLADVAPAAELLILGHTHEAMLVGERRGALLRGTAGTVKLAASERHALNPGSVGQSRDGRPLARCAVLDLVAREVTFHAVRYDVRGCRRALSSRGLPPRAYRVRPPGPVRRVRAAVGRRMRALQA